METIAILFPCFTTRHTSPSPFPVEKASPMSSEPANPQETATLILNMLDNAEKLSPRLDTIAHSIMRSHRPTSASSSWWETKIAETVLNGLVTLVQEVETKGHVLSGAMAEAFSTASAMADVFVREHPVAAKLIVTVIALFVLAVLTPLILEALGFTAEGVAEGSLAARWQAQLGDVAYGSLFSRLQSLATRFSRPIK
ncbi:hypothetical protein BDV97DRAFT_346023 [Delphinella strobiligena]|nr:hypothetical protein BDV97DRAFT_346023 [Delphinella strobiligena]